MSHLSLKNVYFSVLDVHMISHFIQFVHEPILLLLGLQGNLSFLFDVPILLFETLAEFLDLKTSHPNRDKWNSKKNSTLVIKSNTWVNFDFHFRTICQMIVS